MTMTPAQEKKSPVAEDKLDFKRVLPIFVIVLVDLLGLTIIVPLLAYYAAAFGASAFVIGLLGATYPAMQFIGAPVLGRLSDRYGRKPILVISQIGTLIGFLMLGFANALPILFLSRIIDGISGANIATAQAAISDVTTEKNRTQGLGLIGAAFGLGFIVGPVIAFLALAATDNNYHAPAFVAAAFSLVSILLTTFWFKETLPEARRGQQGNGRPSLSFRAMAEALAHPSIGLLLFLVFAQQLAFGGFEQLLSVFALNRLGLNASGTAVVFVFVGIIIVAVQGGLIGRWSRAFGDRRLVFAGLALLAAGLTAIAFTPRQPPPWYSRAELEAELGGPDTNLQGEAPSAVDTSIGLPDDTNTGWLGLAWLLVAMVPVAVGGAMLHPTLNSLITKRVEPVEIGGILGVSAAFFSAANAIAPVAGGAIFEALGATGLFLIWGGVMAVLLVIALRRLTPGREETAAADAARTAGD